MLLQVNNLSCVREDRTLFEHLSFSVAPGDLVQIEGPNGVGKTSLLRLLTGLSQPFAGEVCWNGENIRHCRDEYHANLLYLGHQPGVKAALTPFENLKFYKQLHHPQQTETDLWQILARVGLAGFEENPTGQLSAGQQRRDKQDVFSQHGLLTLQPLSTHSEMTPAASSALTLRAIEVGSRPLSVLASGSAPASSSNWLLAGRLE